MNALRLVVSGFGLLVFVYLCVGIGTIAYHRAKGIIDKRKQN